MGQAAHDAPCLSDGITVGMSSDEERVYPYPTAYEAEGCEGAAAYMAELDAEFPGLTTDERLEAAWAVVPSLMDPWEPYREPWWLRLARWVVA